MEDRKRCRVSVDSVEIIRKKRPHSPSRSKVYITEIKQLPRERKGSKRFSVDEPVEQAHEDKRSIFDPSLRPFPVAGDGCSNPKDFANQVVATDIADPHSTQTGPSLRERTADLPKRCPERTRVKAGRRSSWNHCCDAPRPCCGNQICSGAPKDFQTQADPREIGSSESVQTGPSLAASGSFCRFDYKLRKVKKWPADTSRQCDCPSHTEYHVSCAEDRKNCGSFNQQVKATDIQSSNPIQTTGQAGQCEAGDVILYGTSKRQPSKAYKRHSSSDDFRWCDCMRPDDKLGQRNFAMQVSATNISPTKCIQTERCLSGACICARKIRNTDWDDCRRSCKNPSAAPTGKRTVSQEVRALDISDCTEMQTESSVDLTEVYARKREVCPGDQKTDRGTVRKGRSKDINDDCSKVSSGKKSKHVQIAEQFTQVRAGNINVEDGSQTS
ncbi:hypothetical protein Btru_046641 [Bulinus truncatus]|nr:hypothetical protein Btru_046641 [Bulinus truncatus]